MDKIVEYLPVSRTIACMMVGLQHTHLSSNSTEWQRGGCLDETAASAQDRRRVQLALTSPFSGQVVGHRSRKRWVQCLSGIITLSGTVDWAWSADGRMAAATVVCNRGQHLLTMLSLQGSWGAAICQLPSQLSSVCPFIHPSTQGKKCSAVLCTPDQQTSAVSQTFLTVYIFMTIKSFIWHCDIEVVRPPNTRTCILDVTFLEASLLVCVFVWLTTCKLWPPTYVRTYPKTKHQATTT